MGAKIGMLVVETIAKIRRAYFVHGQPIKAICRDLGVCRKVVRKVIRSEATEFRYEREAQMVFDAHDRAFALFKGTCQRGIYDNMKTAVTTILVGKERLYNRRMCR